MWGAIAGGALSAAGSLFGSKPKAPKFNPYSISGSMLGNSVFDKKKKTLTLTPGAELAGFNKQLTDLASQYGGNSPTQGYQDFAMGQVQGQIPGLFDGALGASQVDANSFNQYMQQMGGAAGNVGGLAGQAGQMGMGMFGPESVGAQMSQGMFGAGMGLMGEQAQDYRDVEANRLQMLEQAAAPYEQRAGHALQQNLFNTGRIGTRGGGQNIQDFATGLGRAQTQRALDAQGFAEQLYGRDQQAALARNQMGYGMMNAGLGGQQNQYNIGGNLMGQAGNLYGMQGGMFGNMFQGAQGFNQLTNDRAQQRLQNAQGIFGFGNQLGQQDITTMMGAQSGYLQNAQQLQEQGALGAKIGSAGMQGGSTPGQTSPFGSFLQGMGGAVAQMQPGMFGFGGGGQAPMPTSIQGAYNPTFAAPTYNGPMPTIGGG
jgi:hypothetical protein